MFTISKYRYVCKINFKVSQFKFKECKLINNENNIINIVFSLILMEMSAMLSIPVKPFHQVNVNTCASIYHENSTETAVSKTSFAHLPLGL